MLTLINQPVDKIVDKKSTKRLQKSGAKWENMGQNALLLYSK